jgi:hypothetical protein
MAIAVFDARRYHESPPARGDFSRAGDGDPAGPTTYLRRQLFERVTDPNHMLRALNDESAGSPSPQVESFDRYASEVAPFAQGELG